MSTDGNGSMPVFNKAGELVGMGIGEPITLFTALREILLESGVSTEEALALVTSNVADRLKLANKGRLSAGNDADLLIITPSDITLRYVVAKGVIMMREGTIIRKGTFESC